MKHHLPTLDPKKSLGLKITINFFENLHKYVLHLYSVTIIVTSSYVLCSPVKRRRERLLIGSARYHESYRSPVIHNLHCHHVISPDSTIQAITIGKANYFIHHIIPYTRTVTSTSIIYFNMSINFNILVSLKV